MNTMVRATHFSGTRRARGPLFLAAGFFDGVHRGHQRVIRAACAAARAAGGAAWVLTFDRHPLKVLAPSRAPLLLTSAEHKARLLERLGVDGCLVLPFNRRWAAMDPLAFLDRLRSEVPAWRAVFVGPDWRFGRQAAGDVACLRRWAAGHGISVKAVAPARSGGRPISSTRIREAIAGGRLAEAARWLGRPFSVLGTVRHGRGIGRRIGFPTANLIPDNEVLPPGGVYAAAAGLGPGRILGGVLNLGTRPTFARPARMTPVKPMVEIHLLETTPRLYGRSLEIFFLQRLRDEQRFETVDALRRQIDRDVQTARRVLEKKVNLQALQKSQDRIHCAPM